MRNSDGNIHFGKPNKIDLVCPGCREPNSFQIVMLGDIIGRRIICKGCSQVFRAYVHWQPKVWTEKEINNET